MSNICIATKAILFEVLKNDSSIMKSTVSIFLLYRNTQDPKSTFIQLICMWSSFENLLLPKSVCHVEYWGKH